MRVVYQRAIQKDGVCIVRPLDLLQDIPYGTEFDRADLEPGMRALETDGYFEMVETEKKGELYYCITLQQASADFARQMASEKRAIKFKIILSVAGLLFTTIAGKIIQLIIGG